MDHTHTHTPVGQTSSLQCTQQVYFLFTIIIAAITIDNFF